MRALPVWDGSLSGRCENLILPTRGQRILRARRCGVPQAADRSWLFRPITRGMVTCGVSAREEYRGKARHRGRVRRGLQDQPKVFPRRRTTV